MKRLKKFLVSLMISLVVFSMPANAEFSSYDSNNLSYIRSDVSTISNYVRYIFDIYSNTSSIYSTLQNVYISVQGIDSLLDNYIPGISSNISLMYADLHTLSNIFTSGVSGWDQFFSKVLDIETTVSSSDDTLSDIYDLLGDTLVSGVTPDYSQTYLAFDSNFFVTSSSNDEFPFMVFSSGQYCKFYYSNSRPLIFQFEPGTYRIYVNLSVSPTSSESYLAFYSAAGDNTILYFSDASYSYSQYGLYRYIFELTFTDTADFFNSFVRLSDQTDYYASFYVYRIDGAESSAINPDQETTVADVDDAGEQQSQQEDQMWQNINTYKSDISFNLDGWDDAAGGLSYVTSVFMTIWNNSPTQPIVLSLMLGIAMLSIGRGVMAAVRVSRNRGDD